MTFRAQLTTTALAAHFAEVRLGSNAAGIDGVTPEEAAADLARFLAPLSAALSDGSWHPARLLRVMARKPDGGVRKLAIPTVADRVVITLLRRVLGPVIEPLLAPCTYAYRPGRSARAAVDAALAALAGGARFVALADVREFFDSIPLGPLYAAISTLPVEPEVKDLARRLLEGHALAPGRGLAQGSALSPLLSNLALTPFDRAITGAGYALIRYCDNLCVPAATAEGARSALTAISREARSRGLRLKEQASVVTAVDHGFSWLGFWFGPGGLSVSESAVAALQARVTEAARGHEGAALRVRLEPIVRGWVQYFDAPLPAGLSLGEHGPLVRELLATFSRAAGDMTPALETPQQGPTNDAPGDDPWELWAEAATTDEGGVAALLDRADQLAAAGDFAGAEAAHDRAGQLATVVAPPPSVAATAWDDEVIDSFLALFGAGQTSCEIAPGRERARFAVLARPPLPADARLHLDGGCALALRPRLDGGLATVGVLDLDPDGPEDRVAAEAHLAALEAVARAWHLPALVEDTGGRGYHLWIPIADLVSADDLCTVLDLLCLTAGPPPRGVKVERLPAGPDEPDLHAQACTLPLGLHAETGRPSRLRWLDGPAIVADQDGGLPGLFACQPAPAELITRLAEQTRPVDDDDTAALGDGAVTGGSDDPDPVGGPAARMLTGCALLRHLRDKASATGHLDHAERLSLLYSFGHLGGGGARAVHAIVARCANYDPAETDRQLGKLTGLPIGCTRLREKHATPELLPRCACDFADVRRRGGYPTPLLHVGGFKRAWREVLRGRREELVVIRQRHAAEPVAVAIGSAAPLDLADDRAEPIAFATPPHEWA